MEIRSLSTLKGLLRFFGCCSIILTALFVLSCQSDSNQKVLPPEKMVAALVDIHLLEQKVASLGLPHDSALQVFDALEARMLQEASVTDSVFKQSMDYYTARPAQMQMIYTAVVDSLHLREQRATQVVTPQ